MTRVTKPPRRPKPMLRRTCTSDPNFWLLIGMLLLLGGMFVLGSIA